MKFSEYKYLRPNFPDIVSDFELMVENLKNAQSVEEASLAVEKINALLIHVNTMMAICHTRHTVNMIDEFYAEEEKYINSNRPLMQKLTVKYYEALLDNRFSHELEEIVGKQLFITAKTNIKAFSGDIMEDLKKENAIRGEYYKLKAEAKFDFDGKIMNLSSLEAYLSSPDRETRIAASKLYWGFYEQNESKFDNIYDRLVKLRHEIALKSGCENFIELGYARLGRTDYVPEDVEKFRAYVKKYIVPLAVKIKNRQKQRFNVEKMPYYDMPLKYPSGNPKPLGDTKMIVETGKRMFSEMSEETKEFYDFMVERELFDLDARLGKQGGGSCTFFHEYKSPFVFSNFNGTSKDIDVMTHEMGHAFQIYRSMKFDIPEYVFPPREAAETHSKSMELMTWPWMELFFGKDALKYNYSHVEEGITFIPYGCAVDEFQHEVYANPNMNGEDRRKLYREIEKKYMPYNDYSENEFLEHGGYWFKQGHIFGGPFYFIEYALAQICAFQFFDKFAQNRKNAMKDYVEFCSAGGSLTYFELLKVGNLENPFYEETVSKTATSINEWLDSINEDEL